jgi:hypothetical protein
MKGVDKVPRRVMVVAWFWVSTVKNAKRVGPGDCLSSAQGVESCGRYFPTVALV